MALTWAVGPFSMSFSFSSWAQWKMSTMKGRAQDSSPCKLSQYTKRERKASFIPSPLPASPHLWGLHFVPPQQ
jgi:hypothetical protein